MLEGARARCQHMKGKVYSKRDRRTCERSVYRGRRRREGERGERKARAKGRGDCRKERPGEESWRAGGERGEEGQQGAVELKGRNGAEIGRGRVPRSGNKKSEAGLTRARGHARRQDGRLRYPSCGTEAWVWRCRPSVTAEARQRRSSLVSRYACVRIVGALAPSPRWPVAELRVTMNRRLMRRRAPNPCASNSAHAWWVQEGGPVAHSVWPSFFHHAWPASQHVCARDSRRRIRYAGGGQFVAAQPCVNP